MVGTVEAILTVQEDATILDDVYVERESREAFFEDDGCLHFQRGHVRVVRDMGDGVRISDRARERFRNEAEDFVNRFGASIESRNLYRVLG